MERTSRAHGVQADSIRQRSHAQTCYGAMMDQGSVQVPCTEHMRIDTACKCIPLHFTIFLFSPVPDSHQDQSACCHKCLTYFPGQILTSAAGRRPSSTVRENASRAILSALSNGTPSFQSLAAATLIWWSARCARYRSRCPRAGISRWSRTRFGA